MRTLRSRLAGLVIVSLAAVLAFPLFNAFYLSPSFSRLIIAGARMEAERTAAHLAESFFDDSGLIRTEKVTPAFRDTIARHLRSFSLEKLKVFAPSGEIVFATEPAEEGMVYTKPYFRAVVATGRTLTNVVRRSGSTKEGRVEQFDVVETYVAVLRQGKVAGVLEIYCDFTMRMKDLNRLIGRANSAMAFMAAILLAALVVAVLGAVRTMRECERAAVAPRELQESQGQPEGPV